MKKQLLSIAIVATLFQGCAITDTMAKNYRENTIHDIMTSKEGRKIRNNYGQYLIKELKGNFVNNALVKSCILTKRIIKKANVNYYEGWVITLKDKLWWDLIPAKADVAAIKRNIIEKELKHFQETSMNRATAICYDFKGRKIFRNEVLDGRRYFK